MAVASARGRALGSVSMTGIEEKGHADVLSVFLDEVAMLLRVQGMARLWKKGEGWRSERA